MVDASIYENLPDEPELAFVVLEQEFRTECEGQEQNTGRDERTDIYWAQYITHVQSTVEELDLSFTGIPMQEYNVRNLSYEQFIDFKQAVFAYTAKVKVRFGRKAKEYSVALDANAKAKLRQLLEKVKKTVDQLDVSTEKKEALFARISALEMEINRNRTKFEVVGALWLEACGKIGEGVDKLEPLRKWLDPIGGLLGQAKTTERGKPTVSLSGPPKMKEITDQRQQASDIDEDIPF